MLPSSYTSRKKVWHVYHTLLSQPGFRDWMTTFLSTETAAFCRALGSWSLEELSMKLGAPKELVHRKLALWQQHGVLREEAGGRYCVVETGSSKEKMERGVMLIDSDEERDSNTTTQSEQREEKLQVPTTHKHNS